MSRATFYHPQLLESDSIVELSAEESVHAVKSRRLRVGQEIRLFNGEGLVADAELSSIHRGSVQATLLKCRQLARNKNTISVLTAIPKGDRQRFMVDMLCQLGVEQITPLNCEHSVTRFNEKIAQKWQRYAIESCKQSQNAWLPLIQEGQHLAKLLELKKGVGEVWFYADRDGKLLANTVPVAHDRTIFIGPEGGFSAHEIELFKAAEGTPVRLSDNILRTEAAAIASIVLLRR